MTEASSYRLSSDTFFQKISDKVGRLKGSDTKAKSARSVMALGIGTFAGRGMRFIRTVILTHILLPDQLGVMAIVMSFTLTFEALTEVGIKQSVIQNKRGADNEYLNVAWWMQVVRGLFLYVIAVLFAPWVSSFYDYPDLIRLLQVAFIGVFLVGCVSPRSYVLEKEYKFGKAVCLIQGSAILGAVVTVILALIMRNVWALVIGFVSETVILCVLSYIFVPFLPSFRIDRKSLSELMKFARGMFGLPILTALSFRLPVLILGKVIPLGPLGLYNCAFILSYIPIDLYIRAIAPVLLPVFSERQNDNNALRRGFLKAARWTGVLMIPLITFMICNSGRLLLMYGSEYVAMAVPFAILCLNIIARSEATVLAGMFIAMGKPHLHRRYALLRALFIIVLTYPASLYFGAVGAALIVVFGNLVLLSAQIYGCRKIFDLKIKNYAFSYIPGLTMSLPVVLTVGLLYLLEIKSAILIIVAGAISLVFSYGIYAGKLLFAKHH